MTSNGSACIRCGGEIDRVETVVMVPDGPKHYTCPEPPVVEFHDGTGRDRYYLIDGKKDVNGVRIVSVTTILREVGDRFGQAAWWGMKVGAQGFDKLLGGLPLREVYESDPVELLKKHKLTTNHVRDAAGARGTSIHAIAEEWARTGEDIDVKQYPPEERGYIEGLRSFILTEKPEPLASEVIVGSRVHAYAGTFDLFAKLGNKLVVLDFKTKTEQPAKGKPRAYAQHHLQLQGYELARREMQMEPSEAQAIVNIYPDGTYGLVWSQATFKQWLACLPLYRSLRELEASIREAA